MPSVPWPPCSQLEQFYAWLKKTEPRVALQMLGEAVGYALSQWPALQTCLEDGRLEIDNNATEPNICPFVMGSKGWLLCQTPKSAQASAALYSIVRSAKANSLEPCRYLRELFEKLPAVSPQDAGAIEALLPWRFAK
jgi:hypothetical protein